MTVLRRILAVSTLTLAGSVVEGQSPPAAQGAAPPLRAVASVRQSESAVRAMPIERRPNRLGHIYGNNVRRRHHGTLFVNRQHSERPLARYLYIAR